MQAAYDDAWNTLMQNVLKVAVMEINNIPVQSAIKLAGQNPPDGMQHMFRIVMHASSKSLVIVHDQWRV